MTTGNVTTEGAWELKGHHIAWTITTTTRSMLEAKEEQMSEHRKVLADYIIELAMEEINMIETQKKFEDGEEEFEHLVMDLRMLKIGTSQLLDDSDQEMFEPGEEEESMKELHVIMDWLREQEVTPAGQAWSSLVLKGEEEEWDSIIWEEGLQLKECSSTRKRKRRGNHSTKGRQVMNYSEGKYI